MKTTYDPRSTASRQELASELKALFERALFERVTLPGTREEVFAREVPGTNGTIRVLVYSTIVGTATRAVAKDAIRVCAVYRGRDGRERGIASAEKRVNRVGEIDAICKRTVERMREVWKLAKTTSRCPKCGAPHFKSKKGNLVCADLCFTRNNEGTRWSR